MALASEKVYRINTLPLDGKHSNPYRATFNRIVRESDDDERSKARINMQSRFTNFDGIDGLCCRVSHLLCSPFLLRSCQWHSRAKCDKRREPRANRVSRANRVKLLSYTAVDGQRQKRAKTLAREERAMRRKNLAALTAVCKYRMTINE